MANFFEEFKANCVQNIIKIKTNSLRFSVQIDEEVYRKSEFNKLFDTIMQKKDKSVELSEDMFIRIFKFSLKDLEVEAIGAIKRTWSIKFPIVLYKPIFRYRKNNVKYLIIDKKKKFFYKETNYMKVYIEINLDNHLDKN